MKTQAKSSRSRGSALRSILAMLLMLSGLALLARAGSSGEQIAPDNASVSQPNQPAATTPGVPRFHIFASPPGIADSVGEPSIGCNWKSEQTFSNSMFSIGNGGRALQPAGDELNPVLPASGVLVFRAA